MTRKELKEHCEKQIEMCEIWAISRGEEPGGKIYEEHKMILELLEQKTWIPVSERLPEEYGEYLITWKNPKYPKTYIGVCECEITDVYDHEHNRFEVEWLFDGYITTAYPDSKVIAWMPLPEPYKEEGE